MNSAKTLTMSLAALLLLGSSEHVQAARLNAHHGSALRSSDHAAAESVSHLMSLVEQDIARNAEYLKAHPSQSLVSQYEDDGADDDDDDSDDYEEEDID